MTDLPSADAPAPPAPSAFTRLWTWIDQLLAPAYARLAVVVVITLIPVIIYGLLTADSAYREATARMWETMRHLGEIAELRQDANVNTALRTLMALSDTPVVREATNRTDECVARLAGFSELAPEKNVYLVVDPAGRIECSSLATAIGASVADRPWFEQIVQTHIPVISGPYNSVFTGTPVVNIAVPIDRPGREFGGAIAAVIDIAWLLRIAADGGLPPQAVVYVVGSSGAILSSTGQVVMPEQANDPELQDELAGLPEAALLNDVVAADLEEFSATGRDGIPRFYRARTLEPHELYTVLGIPTAHAASVAQREFIVAIVGPIVMLIFALLGVALGGDVLIARGLRTLSKTAQSLMEGDLSARPQLRGGSKEVRQLAATLAAMAERLQKHEARLLRSLDEKESLLREIHHRVKNNLQIVTSLMNLEAKKLRDASAKRALTDLQGRIRALAMVHRYLYEGSELRFLDLRAFLGELCEKLQETSGVPTQRVALTVAVDNVAISPDRAVPLSLIITEAVTNAFKHAFPDNHSGTIDVILNATADGRCTLTIRDDGGGPGAITTANDTPGGTGTALLRAFAQQIGGELTITGPPGTTIMVSFDVGSPNDTTTDTDAAQSDLAAAN